MISNTSFAHAAAHPTSFTVKDVQAVIMTVTTAMGVGQDTYYAVNTLLSPHAPITAHDDSAHGHRSLTEATHGHEKAIVKDGFVGPMLSLDKDFTQFQDAASATCLQHKDSTACKADPVCQWDQCNAGLHGTVADKVLGGINGASNANSDGLCRTKMLMSFVDSEVVDPVTKQPIGFLPHLKQTVKNMFTVLLNSGGPWLTGSSPYG